MDTVGSTSIGVGVAESSFSRASAVNPTSGVAVVPSTIKDVGSAFAQEQLRLNEGEQNCVLGPRAIRARK